MNLQKTKKNINFLICYSIPRMELSNKNLTRLVSLGEGKYVEKVKNSYVQKEKLSTLDV
jgi:hypothetical protein